MYPPVEFPVSASTPMISPLIQWEHSEEWYLAKFDPQSVGTSGERICPLSLAEHDYEYMSGHIIDGRCLFPATGYLTLVWETIGMMRSTFALNLIVEFTDIRFMRATNMSKDQVLNFIVMVHRGTGDFEISEHESPIVTGRVKILEELELDELKPLPELTEDGVMLDSRDFYKELRLRGYHYKDEFRSVVQARSDGLGGQIQWNLNFATFMDCMLQLHIVAHDTRNLMIPTAIERIRINPHVHFALAKQINCSEDAVFEAQIDTDTQTVRAGGIEIRGLNVDAISRRKPPGEPVLESYQFVPSFPTPILQDHQAARVIVQLAQENSHDLRVKIVELDDGEHPPLIQRFNEALADLPLVTAECVLVTQHEHLDLGNIILSDGKLQEQTQCNYMIVPKLISNESLLNNLLNNLKEHAFLVSREAHDFDFSQTVTPSATRLVCVVRTETESLLVIQCLKKKGLISATSIVKVSSTDKEFKWIQEVKAAQADGPVLLVAQNEPYSGILGLTNCLRVEPNGTLVSCFFVDDPEAPAFDLEHPFYQNQLRLGLAINVYRKVR